MTYKHQAAYQQQGRMCRGPIYTPPNPFDTHEQYQCFHHIDIQDMTLAELNRERMKVLMCLSLAASPHPWFDERLQRLEKEIERICNPQDGPHLRFARNRDDQRQDDAHDGVVHPQPGRLGPPLSDREIIQRMLSAKNGTRLRALWRGEISAYRCHREAEAALLASLRWWCQGDANQVDRIFRQSGLIVETIGLRR